MTEINIPDFQPQAVVICNGDLPAAETVGMWVRKSGFTVCCDGAVAAAERLAIVPDAVVGDGDSIPADFRSKYSEIFHHVSEQDTNDQTKAVSYLASRGVERIAILGATGRREDHTLGNISLLLEYLRRGLKVIMPTPYGVFVPCCGDVCVACRAGQQISVFNYNATGMRSEGLKYDCRDFDMLWQGTLNEALGEEFAIRAEGYYLIYLANEIK